MRTLKKNQKREKPNKKSYKTKDPSWKTYTYGQGAEKSPFNVEWIKYYNPMEGRDQILFIYADKVTKKICKYRILA